MSRVTCSALVRFIHQTIPSEVTGLLPGRGAMQASYTPRPWVIEAAKATGQAIQGLTLDLTKCYNLIDRSRLLQLLVVMGVPEPLLRFWFMYVYVIARAHEVLELG